MKSLPHNCTQDTNKQNQDGCYESLFVESFLYFLAIILFHLERLMVKQIG